MKPQPIHFVGLDVHQSTVVACVREESGNVPARRANSSREEDRFDSRHPRARVLNEILELPHQLAEKQRLRRAVRRLERSGA